MIIRDNFYKFYIKTYVVTPRKLSLDRSDDGVIAYSFNEK